MSIDKDTVKHISKLARISLDEKKIDSLSKDLTSIMRFIENLNKLNTDKIEPLNNVSTATLPLRQDKVNKQDQSKDVLSNAPEKLENYFAVPKVVE